MLLQLLNRKGRKRRRRHNLGKEMEELKTRFDLTCSTWKRKTRGKWRFALLYAMDEVVVDPAITMKLSYWTSMVLD